MPRNGRGRGGPGRHRGRRHIGHYPDVRQFHPPMREGYEARQMVLRIEELEAMRLVDLEGLTQEQAAMEMGVSRKTLWLDLKNARRKVTQALINGWGIRIEGDRF